MCLLLYTNRRWLMWWEVYIMSSQIIIMVGGLHNAFVITHSLTPTYIDTV